MASAVNQNNLVDIINSITEESDAIVNMINNISTKFASVKSFNRADAAKVKKSVNMVASCISDISAILISLKNLDINNINALADCEVSEDGKSELKIIKAIDNVAKIINSTANIFKSMSQINLDFTGLFLFRLKIRTIVPYAIKLITNELANVLKNTTDKQKETLITLQRNFKTEYIDLVLNIFKLITEINNIKLYDLFSPRTRVLLRGIKNTIQQLYFGTDKRPGLFILLNKVVEDERIKNVHEKRQIIIDTNLLLLKIVTDFSKLFAKISLLTPIILIGISNMPIWFYGIFLLKKAFFKITRVLNRLFTRISLLAPVVLYGMLSLITVIGGLIAVKMFINYFNKLFNTKTLQTSRKKILLISNFFSSIGIIFTELVSFSSIIILGLIAMPLWMLGMLGLWGMLLVVNKIVGFISKIITINSYLSLLDLQMFLTALGIIMFQMSIMAVLSVLGVIGSIGVIAFLVSMTLVMLAMMGFGYLLTAALPVLVPALAGFAVVFVVISLLALMALMLSSLVALDLDKKKVLNSVHTVLGTATAIIDSLFGSKDDTKDGKSGESKSWYSPVLNWMGGNIKMLSAILAVPFLATSIVSIGLILFMATQLRLLQNLDLKKNLILNNVETVLDTVKSVINSLFGPLKLFETSESKTWYGSVLNWMAGKISGIAGLFEAILAIPILVTSMISIGLILFMSLQLRLLQSLDLKENLILNNVSSIIKTCQMVSSSINTPTDDTMFNKKSGLGKLIAFLNPNLSNIVDAISSVPFLAISSISIGMLGLMVDNLNKIQSFKLGKGIFSSNTLYQYSSLEENILIISLSRYLSNIFLSKTYILSSLN